MRVYLYQLSSSRVPDQYIGYTSQYDEMVARWYDKDAKKSYHLDFIAEHGGIDAWTVEILKVCDSREEASSEKSIRLLLSDYTLNQRRPSERKQVFSPFMNKRRV